MGFFSSGTNKQTEAKFEPVNQGYQNLAGAYGDVGGNWGDRSNAAYGGTQDVRGFVGSELSNLYGQLQAGAFNTPGVDRSKERAELAKLQDWYKRMQGTPGVGQTAGAEMTPLTDEMGNPIATYGAIASGASKYYTPEEEYAMRERPASQARAATSAMLDAIRRGGVTGWGGGASGNLAAQKNLLASLRQGNLDVNANLGEAGAKYRMYGREGIERMQGNIGDYAKQIAAARNTPGHTAGVGEYLQLLGAMQNNAGFTGAEMPYGGMQYTGMGGQGSALSGWGNNIANQQQASKTAPLFSTITQGLGALGSGIGSAFGI